MRGAFDFSMDALDFKARLWKKIKVTTPAAALQELDDNDLEWVNAAGMPQQDHKDDTPHDLIL